MTILLINYPELKSYIDNLWLDNIWVIDTTFEDADNNIDIYNPDYIIASNRDDAKDLDGFWHEDIEILKEIIDGITNK